MVVPKSGGCCGSSAKAVPKKPGPKPAVTSTTAKEPTTKATTTTTTSANRKNDEALKKRLKKILGKNNDTKSSSTKGNSDLNENVIPFYSMYQNDIQKFILNAAKKESKAAPFGKIDENLKKTTTAKKVASTTNSNKSPTASVKKTTAGKATASVSDSLKPKSAATLKKASSSVPAKKKASSTSNTKKPEAVQKKGTATATIKKSSTTTTKKAASTKKPMSAPTKKSTTSHMSCGAGCNSRKTAGCGCGDETTSSSDFSDDESESMTDTYDTSYTSDESDTDSSSGGCCGRACDRPQKPSNNRQSRGGRKRQDGDSSGSWKTTESDDDHRGYSKKVLLDWQCEKLKSIIDTSNGFSDNGWICEDVLNSYDNITSEQNMENVQRSSKNKNKEKVKLKRTHQTEAKDQIDKPNGHVDNNETAAEDAVPVKKKGKMSETQMNSKTNEIEIKLDSASEKTSKHQASNGKDSNKNEKSSMKNKINKPKQSSSSNASESPERLENHHRSLVPFNYAEKSDSDYSFNEYEPCDTTLETWEWDEADSSSDFTYEGEEEESDDDFEIDSDTDVSYDESCEDGSEISGDEDYYEDDQTITDSNESCQSTASSYESSVDHDYQLPEGIEEDILIRQGEAKIYNATDDIHFDSDDSSPQIFELPNDEINVTQSRKVDSTVKHSPVNDKVNDDKASDRSSDSCPQLIPIDLNNEYNMANVDEENSSSDDFYSSDSSESSNSEPPNYQPEVINAGKDSREDTWFVDNIFQTSVETISTSNFVDPLTCIMQNSPNSNKYSFIPINAKSFDKGDEQVKSAKNISVARSPLKKRSLESNNRDNCVTISKRIEPMTISSSPQPPSSKFYNSLSQRQVLLLLKSPVYCHGTLKVKLLAGNLSVLGYDFTVGESQELFSPRGNNLLSLNPNATGTANNKFNKSEHDILKILSSFSKDFMQNEIEQIAKEYEPKCNAVVLLERNNYSKRVNMVQKYIKENIFPNSISDRGNGTYKSELFTRCRFFTDCFNSLNINPQWNSVNINESSKLIVIGGKGVGKSTFLRYTINRNLRKFKQFLLIDLDIGQPETFAPQTISATIISKPILGPGYFYGLRPVKSYLYGDINVVLSPLTYLTNVKELFKYCYSENRFSNIPWIVNTMGYNKGFGAELLSVVIEHLQPTDVVQLTSAKQYNNFDFPMSPEVIRNIPRNIYINEKRLDIFDYKLLEFNSIAPSQKSDQWNKWIMTPQETRLAMIIAMLGDLLSDRDQWITDVIPYRVPIDKLNLICMDENNLCKAHLLDVVNANIVYLCDDSKPAIECYGIGIVRGVDKFRQMLYLLPSVPPQTLVHVSTIAVCNIPLPTSILLNQGPKIRGVVPYTYNTNDLITSKHVPQNIYRPQHFLQGARNVILDE